jgi:hypothetical protein
MEEEDCREQGRMFLVLKSIEELFDPAVLSTMEMGGVRLLKEAWTCRTMPAANENFATNWVDWAAQLKQVLFYHFLFFS